jgi:hypothetical protein
MSKATVCPVAWIQVDAQADASARALSIVAGTNVTLTTTTSGGVATVTVAASGGGGGVSAHTALTALAWTSSGHTGTASRLAGFDGSGAASYTQIGASGGVQAWDTDLDGYAALSSTGLVARTGSGTAATRTITAGSAQVTVSDGDGVSGNPTIDLAYASAVRETSGPTTLTIGAMGDGEVAIRSGATLVTLAAPSAADRQGRVLGYSGTTLAWVAMPLIGVLGRGEIVIEGRGIIDVPTCVTVEKL